MPKHNTHVSKVILLFVWWDQRDVFISSWNHYCYRLQIIWLNWALKNKWQKWDSGQADSTIRQCRALCCKTRYTWEEWSEISCPSHYICQTLLIHIFVCSSPCSHSLPLSGKLFSSHESINKWLYKQIDWIKGTNIFPLRHSFIIQKMKDGIKLSFTMEDNLNVIALYVI